MSDPRKNLENPWRNKENLQLLCEKYDTKTEIAKRLGTHRKTVYRWMNRFDLEITEPDWADEETLREAYFDLKTVSKVAEKFDVSRPTIKKQMEECGVKIRKGDPTSDLYDAEKMRQYYEEEGSVAGVRERLEYNTGQGTIIEWLEKHGVERDMRHGARGKRVKVACAHCDKTEIVYESTLGDGSHYCSQSCMAKAFELPKIPGRPYRGGWKRIRKQIRERDGVCQKCKSDPDSTLHVHHIVPVREFETAEKAHDPDNLVALCSTCHVKMEMLSEKAQREYYNE